MKTIIKTLSRSLLALLGALVVCGSLPAAANIPNTLLTQTHTLAPVLSKVMPAIVNLRAVRHSHPDDMINPDGKRSDETTALSLASGVILDKANGIIVTNHHVIDRADEIVVNLSDGRHYVAHVIGSDPLSDIAVLKINANNLTQIELGDSDKLQVGDFVLAIGNPFGLNQSVTSGIVSALGRNDLGLEGYEDFIQTDASINPGNSGGALVDLDGKLIGINTAIITPAGGNIGIGFAIPINMAMNLVKQIVQFGEVRRGLLGVIAQPLTPDLADAFQIKPQEGAIVAHVEPQSIADKAGVKIGDIVIAINDKHVASASYLRNAVGLIPIGEHFTLTVLREGKKQVLTVDMQDPSNQSTALTANMPQLAGLELGHFNKDLAIHGHVEGLEILSMIHDSPAERQGLKPGDIIVSVNQQPVTDVNSLSKLATQKDKALLLRIIRDQTTFFIALNA